jgi:hypothetical protein
MWFTKASEVNQGTMNYCYFNLLLSALFYRSMQANSTGYLYKRVSCLTKANWFSKVLKTVSANSLIECGAVCSALYNFNTGLAAQQCYAFSYDKITKAGILRDSHKLLVTPNREFEGQFGGKTVLAGLRLIKQ